MSSEPVTLKRSINTPLLTLYGLGTIIGAGIYVLVGKVAIYAGIYAPISFLLAALLAIFSGYSYAAMSSRYPKSAGEAVYVQAAFGWPIVSSLVGWMVALTGVVSAATIANGIVGYVQVLVNLPAFTILTGLLLLLTSLAFWGVAESVWVAALCTVFGIVGLLIIIVYSMPAFMTIPERLPDIIPPLTDGGVWFGLLLGAFLAFYAFVGFEDMVNMAEEVKSPEKSLPKAIFLAIVISTLFYYLIALAAILQMSTDELIASKAPLADILLLHNRSMAQMISLISLAAIVNGALVQIIMASRVLYGMAQQQMAPAWFATVHERRKTPHRATWGVGLVIWLLAISLDLTALAKVTSFIIIVVFLLVNVALIVTVNREQQPSEQAMPVKLWVPILAIIMCLLFLGGQLYRMVSMVV